MEIDMDANILICRMDNLLKKDLCQYENQAHVMITIKEWETTLGHKVVRNIMCCEYYVGWKIIFEGIIVI